MKSCLRPETSDAVIKVWKGFGNLYKTVNNWAPDNHPSEFFTQAKEWVHDFLKLNGKREFQFQFQFSLFAISKYI